MVVAKTTQAMKHAYGHYDVQPPIRLGRPPFDPAIEDTADGKVIRGVARRTTRAS